MANRRLGSRIRPTRSVGAPTNWVAVFAATCLVVAIAAVAVVQFVPRPEESGGPPLVQTLDSIDAPPDWTALSEAEFWNVADADSVGDFLELTRPDACSDEAAASWVSPPTVVIVLTCRTGSEDSASKLSMLEVGFAGDDVVRDADGVPPDAVVGVTRVSDEEEVRMVGWAVADVMTIVFVVDQPGMTTDPAVVWSMELDATLRDSGYEAPYVENPRRVGLVVVVVATVFLLLIQGARMAVRAVRAPEQMRLDATAGCSVDVSEAAYQLRWMARLAGLLQNATLLAIPVMFFAALRWSDRYDLGFAGSVLIAPAIVAVIGFASNQAMRRIDGSRNHRWSLRRRRLRSLLAATAGFLAVGVAMLVLGMSVTSLGVDAEVIDRMTEVGRDVYAITVVILVGITVVVVLLLMSLGNWLLRTARNALALSFGDVGISQQPLLLRSFGDDQLRVRANASPRSGLLDAWALRSTDRFEEVLAWELANSGPTVAVSEPGTAERRGMGAVKVQLADQEWRGWISHKMTDAPIILCVLGSTSGFVWEVRELLHRGLLDRTVIVVPPVSAAELIRRWSWLVQNLPIRANPVVPGGVENSLALMIGEDGQVFSVGGTRRDESQYRAAIRACRDRVDARTDEIDVVSASAVGT